MANKKKKSKGVGRDRSLKQIAQTGDSGMIYREFGDRDAKDVVDEASVTWRGIGYSQDTAVFSDWIQAIQGSGNASSGDYVRWRGNIYKITGGRTGDKVQF